MTEPGPDGNIPLGKILRAAAGFDTLSSTDDVAPTAGRIVADGDENERNDTYVGTGTEWINADHDAGIDLAGLPGVRVVRSTDDLPDPDADGFRQLEDQTVYLFADVVMDEYGLELGDVTPLIGWHGGQSGFVNIGSQPTIKTRDVPLFMRNLYVHTPGGTLFDLSASDTTEFLVESCAFSDLPGTTESLGNISDLGEVNGYRVVTFKGNSFGDFEAGLLVSGTSQKVFFSGCPFRRVSDTGVTILKGDSSLDTGIFKISSDCYFKDVKTDTKIVDIDPAASISEYFKYINVDHDSTVTNEDTLNGLVGVDSVGSIVRNSFPLADSTVLGEIALSTQFTLTGSGAGPTEIISPNWNLITGERISLADSRIQYDARFDGDVKIDARVTVTGANTQFEISVQRNGQAIEDRSKAADTITGSSARSTVTTSVTYQDVSAENNDDFGVFLENIGGSTDLDVVNANVDISET